MKCEEIMRIVRESLVIARSGGWFNVALCALRPKTSRRASNLISVPVMPSHTGSHPRSHGGEIFP